MTDQPVESVSGTDQLRKKLAQTAIASLLLLTLLIYVLALVLALKTAKGPFLGVFVEPTLVVNSVGDKALRSKAGGLDLPDHLVALDGQPLTYSRSLYERLSKYKVGDEVTLMAESQSGERRQVTIKLQSFSATSLINFFVLPYGIGLVYLGAGAVVFVARRERAAGRAFPLFGVAVALTTALIFDLYTTHYFVQLFVFGLALLGGSLIDMALVFPQRSSLVLRWPWLSRVVYLPSIAVAVYALIATTNFDRPWAYISAWRLLYFYMALGMFLWMAMMLRRRLRAASALVREQSRVILMGAVAACMPIMVWLLMASLDVGLNFHPALFFSPLVLLPLSLAYAILRYHLLDVDLIVSRSVSYGLLTLLIVSGYLLLVNLFGLVLGTAIEADNPVLVALFVVAVTLTLNPLRTRLHHTVDRLFYRSRIDYRQALEAYSRQLGRLLGQSDIMGALAQYVEDAVYPERLLFYLYDERAVQFVPAADNQGCSGGVGFVPDGGLARLLIEQHETVYLMPNQPLPPILAREASQLEVVGASLYVPLAGLGWMALGEKRSGVPYTGDDLDYLDALGDQTGLALERVQLIGDLERRVNELDALHYISQAINFSVGLDTLLELIYAQTSRVLDTTNFCIALYDEAKKTLSYAFYVQSDERFYPDDEWPLGVGLMGEIVRLGQPILTDDYTNECLLRGLPPGGKAERAWLGVPLNAGDRIIGVMRVASSEPDAHYTLDQQKVFSAIADQAAAILDKARLYDEMEERARQLNVLNEVGSAVNSSLDLETVLRVITEKAAEILEAEASTLFLTDLDTLELVFKVTTGPSADDLEGLRLPPGTGIVGAAAQTQRPIIVNDAQQDERWFSGTDESAGFITRALLSVPLIQKDQTIGVLQVLNKKDGSPFNEQDQQLMLAFAAQAAVAIENARLFTQTDEALAERVAELSMFQQIDQTLNATLDYGRVMAMTLDWTVRMTGAQVGVVATVDEESGGLFVVATQGHAAEYERYREKPWHANNGIVGRVVRTAKPAIVDNVTTDPDYVAAVSETRSQLTVPLRLGDQVIGVINLESPEISGFRRDDLHFVTRLAERAVVPIQNAKLYEQVKRANEAKSKFVSVVAHELKIPMTSIKGYARLLDLGADADVEIRSGFLKTITSNVDRMTKMVNDLLDISRIETERMKLELEAMSIANAIDETLDSQRREIEEKGLELILTIPDDLPAVWGDRTRLIQVLTNLISNAYKYTLEGFIHIEACEVELQLPENDHVGKFVRCAIHDSGIGISEEDQDQLFKSQFVRFDNAAGVAAGHGLGLWLVNRLVEMQGGALTFESKLNKGSTFAFTVPVAGEQAMSASQEQ